jgi:hypothetical protein
VHLSELFGIADGACHSGEDGCACRRGEEGAAAEGGRCAGTRGEKGEAFSTDLFDD